MPADSDLLKEIRDDMRAVRAEMTGALVQMASLIEWRQAIDRQDIEKRVRNLEESRAKWIGWAAGAGVIASLLLQFLFKLVGK